MCFRNKRSEHRSSVSESSSSRSYVSNKGNVKSSESHLSHAGTVASATSSKNLYQRDVVTQEAEEHIARLSEPVDGYMASKDAVPPRYPSVVIVGFCFCNSLAMIFVRYHLFFQMFDQFAHPLSFTLVNIPFSCFSLNSSTYCNLLC